MFLHIIRLFLHVNLIVVCFSTAFLLVISIMRLILMFLHEVMNISCNVSTCNVRWSSVRSISSVQVGFKLFSADRH